MPRKRRWYHQSNTFSAGLLSPAAVDSGSDLALQGLALADNAVILRDGGLKTRGPLVRRIDEDAPTALVRETALSPTQEPTVDPLVGDASFVPGLNRWHGSPSQDGIVSLFARVRYRQFNPDKPLLRVYFYPGVIPFALTFHDCLLRAGYWLTEVDGEDRLTFEVWGQRNVPEGDPSPPPHRLDGGTGAITDPFAVGTFAPGLTKRDVTIRFPGDSVKLDWVEIRVPSLWTTVGTELVFDGISSFKYPGDDALVQLNPDLLIPPDDLPRSQVRIIPWIHQENRYALVLGVLECGVWGLDDEGRPVEWEDVIGTERIWGFTVRQLRELTWCQYQDTILLFHRDFPLPLQVDFEGVDIFTIKPLLLTGVPDLPERRRPISVVYHDLSQAVGDELTNFPVSGRLLPPSNIVVTPGAGKVDLSWEDQVSPITGFSYRYNVYRIQASFYDAFTPEQRDNFHVRRAPSVSFDDLPDSGPGEAKFRRAAGGTFTDEGLVSGVEQIYFLRRFFSTGFLPHLSDITGTTIAAYSPFSEPIRATPL